MHDLLNYQTVIVTLLASFIFLSSFNEVLCANKTNSIPTVSKANNTKDQELNLKPLYDPNFEPTVYIHVGPPKTGTTHIQIYLLKYIKYLYQVNYCYPMNTIDNTNEKTLSYLAMDLHFNKDLSKHQYYINQCLQKKMNLFLSAENLASLNETKLIKLNTLFPKNSKIFIIISYREWLSRIYSHYTEEAKSNLYRAGPISNFLYEDYGHISTAPLDYDMVALVTRYEKIFGSNNTIVLDYHGVIEEKRDLVYVLLCEIVKILCFKTKYMNYNITYENRKPNAIYLHLISLVRDYIHFHGYRFCRMRLPEFSRNLLQYYTNTFSSSSSSSSGVEGDNNEQQSMPPLKKSHLSLLYPYSHELDSKFREKFGYKLLYNSPEAAVKARASLEAIEINEREFYASEQWQDWLQTEIERLVNMGKLCKKKDAIIRPTSPRDLDAHSITATISIEGGSNKTSSSNTTSSHSRRVLWV